MRFGKKIKIAKGISLNLSKSGISTSAKVNGLSFNVGKKGTRITASIPGTGISHTISSPSSPSGSMQNYHSLSSSGNTPLYCFVKGFILNFFFPFGTGFAIYKGLHYLKRTQQNTYVDQPITKADGRYKEGYKIIGYKKVKSWAIEDLSPEGLLHSKNMGKAYLWSIPCFFVLIAIAVTLS